jgi:hypothetical protein
MGAMPLLVAGNRQSPQHRAHGALLQRSLADGGIRLLGHIAHVCSA